ncbi:MAG: S41 family peptidase [Thermoanaerobaculales bacterium]|jgi:carboxyl-terminal processing protease|nr:S41 family peptidase [Thermoanaerobaculales bacterium]
MKRFRTVLLVASLSLVLLFAGLLTAGLTSNESLFQALGNLAEVVHLVQSEYVDELDPEVLALSLDGGILESVDPWAAVVKADRVDFPARLLDRPPAFGVGLSLRFGSAAARYVFDGSPASTAGLETWEVIEKVDGVYTRGRPLWQIALELADRETAGEPVTLTVMDRQVDERRTVELTPVVWKVEHAVAEDLDGIRLIRVRSLTEGSTAAITTLVEAGAPDILDLRGLVWGAEVEAVAVADLFVASGTLAAWTGREAGQARFEATPSAAVELPLVLVDGETEGVGEILAAALQRAGAELVGRGTMGHAPHMQLVRRGELNLWIPVGRWLGPTGEPLHGQGLAPDDEVEAASDDAGGDPILDRALERLRAGLAEAA